MIIYSQEKIDGLAERIQASASIAYTSPLVKLDNELELSRELLTAFASNNPQLKIDQVDLFPLYSVLVTAGVWNKNDDVFDIAETYAARNSPEDKPLNLMHRQMDIVGHITSNYVVDENCKTIAENTPVDELPSKLHVITAAVIYKYWEDNARQREIAQLINEIENSNKWAVSMECIFRGFDYGLIGPDGQTRIVARNEKTAGLTRHLRAYGGAGSFEGYKVGRVLRQIIFSGKGIVDNPANPESIIFDKVDPFKSTFASLGYELPSEIIHEENTMAETNVEKLIADLKTEVITAHTNRLTDLEAKVTKAESVSIEYKTRAEKAESELAQVNADFADFKKKKDEKDAEKDKEKASLKAEVDALTATVEEFKKASKKSSRVEALKKTKAKKNAETLVETFASLDDTMFDAIVQSYGMADDDDEDDKTSADFGAHPVDGEAVTSDSTKTENVNQFGKTSPKNPLSGDCSDASVIASAVVEENVNLGVSVDNDKSFAKVQEDVANYLSKNKKK